MERPHRATVRTRGARPLVVLALLTLLAVVLTASAADARLITGTAKADVLKGTASADKIYARGGNDRINVSGGGIDRVSCGPGSDQVIAGTRDHIAANCEKVHRNGVLTTNFGDEAAPHGDMQHGPATGHLPGSSENVELLGQLKLTNDADDISDVSALQAPNGKWYAYVGDWGGKCSTGGVNVVDISDPAAPEKVRFLNSSGRGYITEGVQALNISTSAYEGDILVLSNEWCAAKPNPRQNPGGITIWDINDPTAPKLLVEAFGDFDLHTTRANEAHSVIAWDAGNRAFAAAIDNEELEDVDIFEITNPRAPELIHETDLPGVHVNAYGTEKTSHDFDVIQKPDDSWHLMVSDWDAGWIDVDVTDPENPVIVGDFDYAGCDQAVPTACPPEGNAHQGEWNSDASLFVGTDEDFSPFRLPITVTATTGPNQPAPGTLYAAGEFSWTLPVATRADKQINGPTIFGGYGCPGDPVPPESSLTLAAGEESIIVFQRGPVQDLNRPGEDGCFFSDKVASGEAAGYDVVIIADHHVGSQGGHHPDSFLCGSQGSPVAGTAHGLCTGHKAMHELFGYPPDFTIPYPVGDPGDVEPDVGDLGAKIQAASQYDGWGYARMVDTSDEANPTEVGQFFLPEQVNPAFASGFGDLTVHEVEVPRNDPNEGGTNTDTDKLAYFSWYSGGLRVVDITDPANPEEVGHYIDEHGNDFWGTALAEDASGNRIILNSDMDYGLFIFRYTGAMP